MQIPKATKLPSGKWNIKMMVNGKRISVTAATKRDVEYQARNKKERLLLDSSSKDARITVGEAIDRWMDARSEVLSPATLLNYNSYRRKHFQSIINTPVTSEIDWQSLINELAKKYSPKTVSNLWGFIVPVLKDCNVTIPKVRLPQVIINERPFLEPEQIHPFMDCIRGDKYELPYLLGLQSLRQSEVLAMTRDKITDTHILVRGARVPSSQGLVYKETNKNSASRRNTRIVIPRIHELVDNFDFDMLAKLNHASLSYHLQVITKANDFPVLTMHTLRHTFVTLCFYLDIDPYDCMLWGGWENLNTVNKHYRHLAARTREVSEQKMIAFFEKRQLV